MFETDREFYESIVGRVVGRRFELVEVVGSGACGVVYRAYQTAVGRDVAIKLMPAHNPLFASRFQREAHISSRLDHPNTITIYDFGETEDGFLFLAMEFLEGISLFDEIVDLGALPVGRALHIAIQVCRSLANAHDNNIVHRDIKPENIFLTMPGDSPDVAKVLDFGIARLMDDHTTEDSSQRLTRTGTILGTPIYMAPEQFVGADVDHRADIYSLGILLFEMLTGRPPFESSDVRELMEFHCHGRVPPLQVQGTQTETTEVLHRHLESIIRECLAKRVEDRLESVHILLAHLEAIFEALPREDKAFIEDSENDTQNHARARAAQLLSELTTADLEVPDARVTHRSMDASYDDLEFDDLEDDAFDAIEVLEVLDEPYSGSMSIPLPEASSRGRRGWLLALLVLLGVGGIVVVGVMLGGSPGMGNDDIAAAPSTRDARPVAPEDPELAASTGEDAAPAPPTTLVVVDTAALAEPPSEHVVRLTVQLEPAGATLSTEGRDLGQAPLVIDVPRSMTRLPLLARLEGHEDVTWTLEPDLVQDATMTWRAHLPSLALLLAAESLAGGVIIASVEGVARPLETDAQPDASAIAARKAAARRRVANKRVNKRRPADTKKPPTGETPAEKEPADETPTDEQGGGGGDGGIFDIEKK